MEPVKMNKARRPAAGAAPPEIHPTAVVDPGARLGHNVSRARTRSSARTWRSARTA